MAWSQLEPTQCETLVSVLLLREFPDGVRIRPSRGDGGIDVLVPVDLLVTKYDVYQIKYFWSNLGGGQKRQIEGSIRRIKRTVNSNSVSVRRWHLTMQINPTRENLGWIQCHFAGSSITALWKGLDYLNGLTAKYPTVVDYYVNNGARRTAEQIDQLIRLSPLLSGAAATDTALDLATVQLGAQTLFDQLNRIDPHYYYELHVTNEVPDLAAYATARTMMLKAYGTEDGPCLTVSICSHYNEAPADRPFSINVRLLHDDPTLLAELEDFRLFGGTLRAGPDRASVLIVGDPWQDSGDDYKPASVELVYPPNQDVGRSLRMVARTPDGSEAHLPVQIIEKSVGPCGQGLRVRMRSKSRGTIIRADFRLGVTSTTEGSAFHLEYDWNGKAAAELVADADFYEHLVPGGRIFLAPEYGNRRDLFAEGAENLNFPVPSNLLLYVRWLAAIQEFAEEAIVVPNSINADEFNAARMLILSLRVARLGRNNHVGRSSARTRRSII